MEDLIRSLSIQSRQQLLLSPLPLGVQPPLCPCYPYQWSFTQDTAGLYLQDQIKLPYNFFLLAGARYQYIHQAVAAGEAPDELQPLRTADRTGADAALRPAVAAAGMAEPL